MIALQSRREYMSAGNTFGGRNHVRNNGRDSQDAIINTGLQSFVPVIKCAFA